MKKRILALFIMMLFWTLPAAASYESELAAFPSRWQTKLAALHEKYPDWVFIAVPTGLRFADAVAAECGKKSLVEKYYSPFLKSHAEGNYDPQSGSYTFYDASTWQAASGAAVSYFMNPANFLNETYIFQFEALSYDRKYHSQSGVELILKGTFMHNAEIVYPDGAGGEVHTGKKYATVIMEAAEKNGVSPYYLASKIRTEIGSTPSGSVTGKYPGYEGIYNFYNIGASDSKNPIANGLNWASLGTSYSRPWNTPEKSIVGGAAWIGELYISKGQNTMYLERFNVGPNTGYGLYTHQYMTNLYGAAGQAQSTYTGYKDAGTLSEDKVFYIPTFSDMPASQSTVTFAGGGTVGARCNYEGVNVRSGPSASYQSVGRLSKGQAVTVLSGMRTDSADRMAYIENPYWYKIKCGMTEGYISAVYADPEPSVTIKTGESVSLSPVTEADAGTLYWENHNSDIVAVDTAGNVTAKKSGTAVVYAFTAGGGMAVAAIQVKGGFSDMKGHWAAEAVETVTKLGLFQGTGDTTFSPEEKMTRAMFITVVGRLYASFGGRAEGNVSLLPYLDVDENAYYASYTAWAYDGGILPFAPSTVFSPSAAVTRGEMAVAAYNLASYIAADTSADTGVLSAFSDRNSIPDGAERAAAWCIGHGVISGMGGGRLGFSETATRAQVAQIMVNLRKVLQ